MSRLRNWCFTLHIDEQRANDTDALSSFISVGDNVRYAVWQLERCPQTQRPHIQGYIEFNSPLRISAVKRIVGDAAHLEQRRGTREQAREYCQKEDSRAAGPWECGDFDTVKPGRRTDLDDVAQLICSGAKLSEIVESHPTQFIKFSKGIQALHTMRSQAGAKHWRNLNVMVYWGEAGSGKTRKAIEEAEDDFFILDQGERVWFDGYDGEGTLIIDDFYGWIRWGQFLRILDGHPYRCEIKGGFRWAQWTRVVITSNCQPSDWYESVTDPRKRAALNRRIHTITQFNLQQE